MALEIYRFSTEAYDVDGDFPVCCGSPEECFSTTADLYVWEYDVFSAGASCGLRPEREDDGGFLGRSAVVLHRRDLSPSTGAVRRV